MSDADLDAVGTAASENRPSPIAASGNGKRKIEGNDFGRGNLRKKRLPSLLSGNGPLSVYIVVYLWMSS